MQHHINYIIHIQEFMPMYINMSGKSNDSLKILQYSVQKLLETFVKIPILLRQMSAKLPDP